MAIINNKFSEILALCKRFDVKRLELFGSQARGDFQKESDIDFLVEFNDVRRPGISNRYFGLAKELEKLFHKKVDLVDINGMRNPYFIESVNKTRKVIYGS